jgi:tetratricopeptide (TPR) repeat protein
VRARQVASTATPVERGLVEAVATRYADPPPPDRTSLDEAYARAMQDLYRAYSSDADIGAFTAESILDLRPWDQWTADGRPQPGTLELVRILNGVLAESPDHVFALHLLIHALEASPNPEKADYAADRLRDLAGSQVHFLHMPSHIDIRRGRWTEAIVANRRSLQAVKSYRYAVQRPFEYNFSWNHQYHMLAYAAMMQGRYQVAKQAIQDMLNEMPEGGWEQLNEQADGYFAMQYELNLRFGQWASILAEPAPADYLPLSIALWHYARGIAYAATQKLGDADAEEKAFAAACKEIPSSWMFGSISASELMAIASDMLHGEILYRRGKIDESVAALRRAVHREDALRYVEPPAWIIPVRHALGAVLLERRRYDEARAVYREDLARHPENGWALFGEARSLVGQGRKAEALIAKARFEQAWQYADFKISSSCCCLPGRDVREN